jgi:hypothetical protein
LPVDVSETSQGISFAEIILEGFGDLQGFFDLGHCVLELANSRVGMPLSSQQLGKDRPFFGRGCLVLKHIDGLAEDLGGTFPVPLCEPLLTFFKKFLGLGHSTI